MRRNDFLIYLSVLALTVVLVFTSGCSSPWQVVRAFPSQMVHQEQRTEVVPQDKDHHHYQMYRDNTTAWHLVYSIPDSSYFFMVFVVWCYENEFKPMYMTLDSTTLDFIYNQNRLIDNGEQCLMYLMSSKVSDSTLSVMLNVPGISVLSVVAEKQTVSLDILPNAKHQLLIEFGFKSNL